MRGLSPNSIGDLRALYVVLVMDDETPGDIWLLRIVQYLYSFNNSILNTMVPEMLATHRLHM